MAAAETILVVDDNVETLRLMAMVLRRHGYQVLAARDGVQALAMAQRQLPNLILLDVMMPGMDGLEVTRRLRATPETAAIPILMFTAKSGLEDELKGFEVGADDYLTKLASPPELLARVKALLARSIKPPHGRMIGLLAARGGLGVSTVALNLGIALSQQSREEVIVADFRPGQGSIALSLGFQDAIGLSRLLQADLSKLNQAAVENELVRHKSGVRLLLSSFRPADARQVVQIDQFKAVALGLGNLARFVLLDLGPALNPISAALLPHLDELLVVLEPVSQTVQQTRLLVQDLQAEGVGAGKIHYVLVNRGGNSIQPSWRQVQDDLGYELEVVITPAAEMAFQAANNKLPMITMQPESVTAQQFTKLAKALVQHAGPAAS